MRRKKLLLHLKANEIFSQFYTRILFFVFSAGPIKKAFLSRILSYLFPDSEENPEFPYPEDLSGNNSSENKDGDDHDNMDTFGMALAGIKSCPVDGLVWRLTIVMAHCINVLGKIGSL